jgi:hypothetical protein
LDPLAVVETSGVEADSEGGAHTITISPEEAVVEEGLIVVKTTIITLNLSQRV